MRNDVFKCVLDVAKEPDKLQYELILWDDLETLFEIVNRRIVTSLSDYGIDVLNWADILEPGFAPEAMKAIIRDSVVWRPRDIIYFFERALFYARSRGSRYLANQDFTSAMTEYSEYAFRSLSAESQPYIPKMENLVLEFAEGQAILSLEDVEERLKKAGIKKRDIRKTVDFLIESNFLGYRSEEGGFRFPITPTESAIMTKAVWNHGRKNRKSGILKIHNAFHDALIVS